MAANKKKLQTILGVCLFILYLMCLFYFLFFAEELGRTDTGEYRYNLTLLKEIRRYYVYRQQIGWKLFLLNVVGNVVAFIPFGFFLPMLKKKRKLITLTTLWGFSLSLCVELIQFVMKLGSFDVDDILLNTIGALLGAIIYSIVHHLRKRK